MGSFNACLCDESVSHENEWDRPILRFPKRPLYLSITKYQQDNINTSDINRVISIEEEDSNNDESDQETDDDERNLRVREVKYDFINYKDSKQKWKLEYC